MEIEKIATNDERDHRHPIPRRRRTLSHDERYTLTLFLG
jgi:hypothetical protein